MRIFNTTGACDPSKHFTLPSSSRLGNTRVLIDSELYFVLHSPRQSGKTTALRALASELTAEGKYAALHFSCESAEPAGDDYERAEQIVLNAIRKAAEIYLPEPLHPPTWPSSKGGTALGNALREWSISCPKPLVLFFDEIDALRGESLRSVLRQLRDGHPDRPKNFPQSIVLCGLRDVRDYKKAGAGDANRLGTSSPFNVKAESLRLVNFTKEEVRTLYQQYVTESGQAFSEEAMAFAFDVTQGQPWLVNALANEIVFKMKVPLSETITVDHLEKAKERLIHARATHLDSLVARLMEPRVRNVISPVLQGTLATGDSYNDDVSYVSDLGLIAPTNPIEIANPIYREVIVRVLSAPAEGNVVLNPKSFVMKDGRINVRKLLEEFTVFWRENSDILETSMPYPEVAAQLVLMAFFHRVVNGGGYIQREFGVGRRRIDMLVQWPYMTAGGKYEIQRQAVELKVWRDKKADPLIQGLEQLEGYLDTLGLNEGVLALFDQRSGREPVEERTKFEMATTAKGYQVTVLRA